jgi:hypothetical protein
LVHVGIASAIEARRSSREVQKERKTIADMIECEERLTLELRGESYAVDIADLEEELGEMRTERQALRVVREANGLSNEAMAGVSLSIANLTDSIVNVRLQIKTLRLKQRSESNSAAVTLMKSKGAFDPRNPAVTDVGALLNATLRNIIDAKIPVPEHLTDWMKDAEDAIFSIGARDAAGAVKALPGGAPKAARPVLFTRKDPKQANP